MADGYQLRLGPPIEKQGEIKPGESATIGSGGDARIVFAASEPVHCRFEVTTRGLEVFNVSKGGTFVNGRKVERALLKDGDELKLGTAPDGIKVWVRAPGAGDLNSSAERFTAQTAASTQQKTQAFSKDALAAAAAAAKAGAAPPAAPPPAPPPAPQPPPQAQAPAAPKLPPASAGPRPTPSARARASPSRSTRASAPSRPRSG